MQKTYIKATIFFIVLLLLFLIFKYDFSSTISSSLPVMKEEALHDMIKEHAKEYEEEPEDAYIDRVWKKTPGLEGRKVDIQKSYEKMTSNEGKYDPNLLVFESISPKVGLDDLPSAPVYRGHPEKNMVSLLINVSWGTEHVPIILQTLKENQVKATFFIEGQWAVENKDMVKMISEQGHVIGNHAFNHPDMANLTDQQINEQINKTNDILKAIIGKTPKWFAPPSGSFNDKVVQIAHEQKMQTILWTVDTIDWQNPTVSVMLNRVMKSIHPGATILMHPTDSVAQGLDRLIKDIKQEKYQLGTIEQLLQETR